MRGIISHMAHPASAVTVLLALAACCCRAWEEKLPHHIVRDYVQADAVLDETPCDWRETVEGIFRPAVRDCRNAREAALLIASHMTQLTGGVHYSPLRSKPNMNALETLSEKKASCTGLSILLACALRSVGIPARAAFVITWNHVAGNHTWVEAWLDGKWEMLECNQSDFNTPWALESIGMLNTALPEQHVYAVSPTSDFSLPLFEAPTPLEDVTERYMMLARKWYENNGLPTGHRRLMVDVRPRPAQPIAIRLESEQGELIAEIPSPTRLDDMRRFASLNMPIGSRCFLRLGSQTKRTPVPPCDRPAQVIQLPYEP